MKKISLIIVFLKIVIIGWTQPNQSTGLLIKDLVDYNGDAIQYKNKKILIKHYILSDKKHKVIDSLSDEKIQNIRNEIKSQGYYFMADSYERNGKKKDAPNQRLMLIYQTDTLTIDFIDIGQYDVVEEIVFFPEYFKIYRDPAKKIKDWDNDSLYPPETRSKIRELLKLGISHKVYPLSGYRLLENKTCKDPFNVLQKYQRLDCLEKKSEIKGYTILCEQNFNTIDSILYLQTNELSIKVNKQEVYQFYYYYTNKYRVCDEYYLAFDLLKKIEFYNLYINQKKFTGMIRLVVPQLWDDWLYYDLWKMTYEEGLLKKREVLNNVDPITEEERSSPAGR